MNLDDLQDASLDDPRFGAAPEKARDPSHGVMAVPMAGPAPVHEDFQADGSFRPLDDNFVSAARIGGWIAAANVMFLIPVAVSVYALVQDSGWGRVLALAFCGILMIGASIFGAHFWPVLEFRHTRWRIDPDGLEIRRGVVWRHTISVPRERIQHTDVAQGPIQRRFGLATLSVHTAGTHHSQIELPGISYATAQAVRNFLLEEALGDDGGRGAAGESFTEDELLGIPLTEGAMEPEEGLQERGSSASTPRDKPESGPYEMPEDLEGGHGRA